MTRLLCGNVVSDAYFEDPIALPEHAHRTGAALGVRMLWLARPDDVVLLGTAPSCAFLTAVKQVVGFLPTIVSCRRHGRETLPESVLADVSALGVLRETGASTVLPYACSEDVYRLAGTLGMAVEGPSFRFVAAGGVRRANSKTFLRSIAADLALPLPTGEVRHPCEDGSPTWREHAQPLIVKERLSGGGLGNTLIPGGGQVTGVPSHPFVIERFESFCTWPSADFVIGADGQVDLRQVSSMRVTGDTNAYDGVTIPVTDADPASLREVVSIGRVVGAWWAAHGYRGWFDIDAGITTDRRCLITEMNARLTGGTPIDAIARGLVGDDYARRATILAREHLTLGRDASLVIESILEADLVPTPAHPVGIVPLWESPDRRALGYLVLAETAGRAADLEQQLIDLARPRTTHHDAVGGIHEAGDPGHGDRRGSRVRARRSGALR
jgi:hypothetical protein